MRTEYPSSGAGSDEAGNDEGTARKAVGLTGREMAGVVLVAAEGVLASCGVGVAIVVSAMLGRDKSGMSGVEEHRVFIVNDHAS